MFTQSDDSDRDQGTATGTTTAPGDHGSRNHNFLSACAATVLERFGYAKQSSRDSLGHLRVVGETLNEAKETLKTEGKGAFGAWCDAAQFPFDRAWRARLMKLAANWEAIIAAVEALPNDKRSWSVDGVLAIWTASQRQQTVSQGEGEEGESGEGETTAKERKETKAERLERLLQEALERIANLEAENAKLKGGSQSGKGRAKNDKADWSGTAWEGKVHDGPKVNAATRARAVKVHALWTRGGTDGEKQAAKERLEEMASKSGLSFEDFLAACGLTAA